MANKKKELTKDDFKNLSSLMKIFSDPTRIEILYQLSKKELCVDELATLLNITKSAISHQLKPLKMASLVKYRRQNQNLFYSLADEHVEEIIYLGFEHLKEYYRRNL